MLLIFLDHRASFQRYTPPTIIEITGMNLGSRKNNAIRVFGGRDNAAYNDPLALYRGDVGDCLIHECRSFALVHYGLQGHFV